MSYLLEKQTRNVRKSGLRRGSAGKRVINEYIDANGPLGSSPRSLHAGLFSAGAQCRSSAHTVRSIILAFCLLGQGVSPSVLALSELPGPLTPVLSLFPDHLVKPSMPVPIMPACMARGRGGFHKIDRGAIFF